MYLTAKSGCAGNAGDSLQLREVLAAAAAPYFGMLEAWLWQGRIQDPFQEFMVQQAQQQVPAHTP